LYCFFSFSTTSYIAISDMVSPPIK
jgi:hypothetical protein